MTAVVLTQEEPVCAREGNGAQNCVNGQLVGPDPGRLRRNPAQGISPPGQPAIFSFAMKTGALDGYERTRMLFQRTEPMRMLINCQENKFKFFFGAT